MCRSIKILCVDDEDLVLASLRMFSSTNLMNSLQQRLETPDFHFFLRHLVLELSLLTRMVSSRFTRFVWNWTPKTNLHTVLLPGIRAAG